MAELSKQLLYPGNLKKSFETRLEKAGKSDLVSGILRKNPVVFRKKEKAHQKLIASRLGWIEIAREMQDEVDRIEQFVKDVKDDGLKHFLLLGMGGSSLGPEVWQKVFGPASWLKSFHIADTTVPTTLKKITESVDLRTTFVVISSKSGTTMETLAQYRYFFRLIKDLRPLKAGTNFGAITDDGSEVHRISRRNRFRELFLNREDIGGRFSALSYFGLVPAAFTKANLKNIVGGAVEFLNDMETNPTSNAALELGAFLAAGAMDNFDKLHLQATPELAPFISWIEQLIAESTGKDEKGILPVNSGSNNDCFSKADDRLYVYFNLKGKRLPAHVQSFNRSRTPAVVIELADPHALGAEMLKWEMAVSVASAIMGVNPFDEPNVAESKKNTLAVLDAKKGRRIIVPDPPLCTLEEIIFEFDTDVPGIDRRRNISADEIMPKFVEGLKKGDYVSLLCYGEKNNEVDKRLTKVRDLLEKHDCITVHQGYGPRYLHSVGQFHKGGRQNGHFLVFEQEYQEELDIPKLNISFNRLISAQAEGDIKALRKRNRPVVHVKLRTDPIKGLDKFIELLGAVK